MLDRALLARYLRQRAELGERELFLSFARSLLASVAMIPPVRWVADCADWSQAGHLISRATVLLAAVTGKTYYKKPYSGRCWVQRTQKGVGTGIKR